MYRVIEGFPKYRVGRDGSLWSLRRKSWKRLRPVPDGKGGYPRATLYRFANGRYERQQLYVHALMLAAFVGPRPEGMVTRHSDGNPANNRLTNLCYGTPAENAADRIRHGRNLHGEGVGTAKLTEAGAREALWLFENVTRNRAEIARRLGIGRVSVNRILNGETWRHVLAA